MPPARSDSSLMKQIDKLVICQTANVSVRILDITRMKLVIKGARKYYGQDKIGLAF